MNNEEHGTQPETDEFEQEKQREPVIAAETAPTAKPTTPFGSVLVMSIAVVCLLVVFGVIYLVWTEPEPSQVIDTPEVTEPTESADVTESEPEIDPTFVPGRDPDVLGLRIDPTIGRFLTVSGTGQTLYVTDETCVTECLNDWTPYEAETAIEDGVLLGTTERTDGTFQYTWNGQALYTYNLDDDRSVLGDGYEGTWRIARP